MFKKNLLSFAFLAALMMGALQVSAQKVVVKINPLSLAILTANIQGEYALNEKMSAQLGFFVGSVGLGANTAGASGGIKYNWFGVTPEFRYYVQNASKDAPRGLYVAPFLRYQSISIKYDGSYYDPDLQLNSTGELVFKTTAIGGGVTLGYQWLFGDVIALDLFLGPQYINSSTKASVSCTGCDGDEEISEYVGINFGGLGIRTGLAIGVAF